MLKNRSIVVAALSLIPILLFGVTYISARESRQRILWREVHEPRPNLERMSDSIRRGADVNARKTVGGFTVLHTAINTWSQEAHLPAIQLLIDNGADVNASVNGFTPLMSAVQMHYAPAVKLLIDKGANVNAKTTNGETVIDVLDSWGDFNDTRDWEILDLLVKSGLKDTITNKVFFVKKGSKLVRGVRKRPSSTN